MGARIGAGTYLLAMSATINAWCLAMTALFYYLIAPGRIDRTQAEYVMWGLGAIVGCVFFYLTRRRLQDLNFPGYLVWILALPFPGVIFLPVLCFLSAPRFRNRFGPPPIASRSLKITLALVCFAGALLFVPFVAVLYAPLKLHSAF